MWLLKTPNTAIRPGILVWPRAAATRPPHRRGAAPWLDGERREGEARGDVDELGPLPSGRIPVRPGGGAIIPLQVAPRRHAPQPRLNSAKRGRAERSAEGEHSAEGGGQARRARAPRARLGRHTGEGERDQSRAGRASSSARVEQIERKQVGRGG